MRGQTEVMVVDDDLGMCHLLRSFLSERGYQAVTMVNAEDALQRYHAERPAAIILDVTLPGPMDGLEALAAFRKIDRDVPVIMLSADGRTPTVVQAMKLGASDFIGKPFKDIELEISLKNALKHRQLSRHVASLREELQLQGPYPMLFRHSERMAEVRDIIDRVADTDVTVLIHGESGTGKELVARALSASSLRRDKPFVKVNCAALPADLLESELFGFERGAFTGALQQKPGKFEFANHGTLFLDEIGDMSPALQAKLLRVLQDGEFSRLGGTHDLHVDVRIVAATNCDLERAVAQGHFREDLFFRLNVVPIHLPPLRERREEIPLLTDHFLKKYSVQYNKPFAELSEETMALLVEHDWPGNVRELENVIKRIVVLGDDAATRRDLSRSVAMAADRLAAAQAPGSRSSVIAMPERPDGLHAVASQATHDEASCSLKDISRIAARKAERELISRMLQQTRWNRKETAGILGISYKALLYKIKENGLDKAS
jgi:two-component system, NtrC family, response regulator AtoC